MNIAAFLSGSGNETLLYAGRLLTGFSGGLFGSVFSIYNYEVMPDEMMASGGAI